MSGEEGTIKPTRSSSIVTPSKSSSSRSDPATSSSDDNPQPTASEQIPIQPQQTELETESQAQSLPTMTGSSWLSSQIPERAYSQQQQRMADGDDAPSPEFAPPRPPRQEESSNNPFTSLRAKFQKRISLFTQNADQQWSVIGDNLLREPNEPIKRSKQLSRLVRRFGVPDSIRAAFWMNLSGATAQTVAGEYWHTVNVAFAQQQKALRAEKGKKSDVMKRFELTISQIETDVARVSSVDPFFRTTEGCDQLRRVLLVFSQRNLDIGYCQNMFPIATMLLTKLPEEEAFWMFETIVNFIMPKNYFSEDMSGLLVDVEVMNQLAQQHLPDFMEDCENEGITLDIFLTKWFSVMFVGCVSERVCDRIIDLVVYKGFVIIFRITLGILSLAAEELEFYDKERAKLSSGRGDGSASKSSKGADSARTDSATSADGEPPKEEKIEFETRTGFIMYTLQNLPKDLTEAQLMERTFCFRNLKSDIAEKRRIVQNQMRKEHEASISATTSFDLPNRTTVTSSPNVISSPSSFSPPPRLPSPILDSLPPVDH